MLKDFLSKIELPAEAEPGPTTPVNLDVSVPGWAEPDRISRERSAPPPGTAPREDVEKE